MSAVPPGRVIFVTIPAIEVAGYFHLSGLTLCLCSLESLEFLRGLHFRSSHRHGIGTDSCDNAISIRTFAVHNLRVQSPMFSTGLPPGGSRALLDIGVAIASYPWTTALRLCHRPMTNDQQLASPTIVDCFGLDWRLATEDSPMARIGVVRGDAAC